MDSSEIKTFRSAPPHSPKVDRLPPALTRLKGRLRHREAAFRRFIGFYTPSEPVMTFAIRNLSVLSYAQGFTLWHYRAGAARLDDVATLGFFNNAGDPAKRHQAPVRFTPAPRCGRRWRCWR